ncbi:MAG: chemotaxis protein CheA [Syntrophobacteraceae bacterium]
MIGKIVEKLACGLINGPDDLLGIGECLNLLDELEKVGDLPQKGTEVIEELRALFNLIILDESKDPRADWQSIRRLIATFDESVVGGGSDSSATADETMTKEWGSSESECSAPDAEALNADREVIEKLMAEEGSGESTAEQSGVASAADSDQKESSAAPSTSQEEQSVTFDVQDAELLRDFLDEAKEHLSSIELNLLALEENPENQEAINDIFRPFHSVKGVAGFLNLKEIHHLSHQVENLLDEARSGKLKITDDVIDIVLKAVDLLKGLLENLEVSLSEGAPVASHTDAVEEFLDRLNSFRDRDVAGSPAVVRKVGEILVDHGVVETKTVEDAAVESTSKGNKLGEELISKGAVTTRDVSSALREQRHAKESAAYVRIDTQKLDSLVDMVGELVIAQSMVLQNSEVLRIKDQKYQQDSVQLRRITNELQRISMSMRMIPIKSTFQKMIRLVRDLSKKSGKEAVLEMRGEETELDRNMVEEIYDPLVHMIRNAIDHGIETPEVRLQAGKAESGTILIAAEQKGGNVIIDIEDDGKGIDPQKVRAIAIQRNIISPDDQLDDRFLCELIFHPGFSTKEVITEVSGRGVGMDVVKKSVERLRGKIEIFNNPGKGCRFQFKLPLTMAIIDGMIINVGNERYVVPTVALKESIRPSREAYMTVHGRGETIKVRNSLMPLIRLHEVFGIEPKYRDPWDGLLLVVNEDGRSYCLLADQILGRQEVVIKSLGTSLRNVSGVSGGAILGDGKVALIVDVKGVVSLHEGH